LPSDGKSLPPGLAGPSGAGAFGPHNGAAWDRDAGLLVAHGASSMPHGAAAGAQAAGLASAAAGTSAGIDGGAATQGQAATSALPAPPGAGFDQGLAQRLVWMVQHGFRDARLHLHPEHLGAVDVHLTVDDAAAQVTLSSPHAMVREAMTQAVPQLRDLLGSAGLMLSHVNVDAGQSGGSGSFGAHAGSDIGAAPNGTAVSAADETGAGAALRMPAGLVDLFA
jgi:flagellar hook-length control protein FliK